MFKYDYYQFQILFIEGTDEEWNEPKRKRGRPRVRPLGESKEEDLDQGYYNTGWFKNDLSAC